MYMDATWVDAIVWTAIVILSIAIAIILIDWMSKK